YAFAFVFAILSLLIDVLLTGLICCLLGSLFFRIRFGLFKCRYLLFLAIFGLLIHGLKLFYLRIVHLLEVIIRRFIRINSLDYLVHQNFLMNVLAYLVFV